MIKNQLLILESLILYAGCTKRFIKEDTKIKFSAQLLNKCLITFLFLFLINIKSYSQNQTFTAVEDAQVYESSVNANYANSPDLLVKIHSGLSRYSYVKFNLSAYQLSKVGRAVVRLYCRNKANSSINNIINALAVSTNSWTEASLNYSNKPATGTILASSTITAVDKYYEWDITDYIKSLNITSSSNTLVSIAFSDSITTNNTVTFNSKESPANTPPQLVIDETVENYVYYVDSESGNDDNDGLSEATAWQSLAKVNANTYTPGSKILFKRGGTWIGQLMPKGSGAASKPIIIDSYGGVDDPKPLLNGNGVIASGVIKLNNQAFWEIKNLDIINDAAVGAERRGVEITASNYGLIEHIYLINLTVHDIKGTSGSQMSDKKSSGIYITVEDDATLATRYNDILIEGCIIYNCQNQGIVTNNEKSIDDYPRTANWEKRKITNLIIRNNTIHHVSKSAMVISLADGGLVERNLCYETALNTAGNTMLSRSSINTIFQYNEGYLNRSPSFEGSMYGADLNSPGVIFQYSYSHDNAQGLLWVNTSIQDTGIVARYNMSRADKGSLIHFALDATDVRIYNNTFYIPANLNPNIIEEDYKASHKYVCHNNLVYNENTSTPLTGKFVFATSPITFTNTDGTTETTTQDRIITDNLFYRTTRPSEINFASSNLVTDPLLLNPGSGTTGLNSLGGYKLKALSPALNKGKIVANNGTEDYFGITVSATTKPNIGFYNGPGTNVSAVDPNFHIYLITGQSNMSGRGPLSDNIDISNPRIKLLTKAGTWVTATHPLHIEVEPNIAGVGPGLAFAIKMLEGADPNITIGLIATAVGGQSISVFSPGVTNTRTGLSIYNESVSKVNLAKTQGVLKGILFHQGESNNGTASTWPDSVKKLINNFRVEFNDPKLPFILGELGRFPTVLNRYSAINNAMPRVKNEVLYTDIVSSAGLLAMDVTTHFDSPSATELGIRYATAMKNMLTTLPIQLLSFKGKAISDGVLLSWETASEKNNSMFVIERSGDGNIFTKIGELKGTGDSNALLYYKFSDLAPLSGDNYYRLKQIDYDGSQSYSDKIVTVQVMVLPKQSSFLLAPNPVKDVLNIYLKDISQKDVIVSIYDVNGKQLSKEVFDGAKPVQSNVSQLQPGMYILEVINKSTSILLGRSKIIKD